MMNQPKLICLLLFLALSVKANGLIFKQIGLEDGLAQINVMSIYQDEFGRMWFGTTEGVSIYNGNNMQTVHPSKTNEGLTHNIIYEICGNKAGLIYLLAGNNLIRYDMKKQTFDFLLNRVNAMGYFDQALWFICENKYVYKLTDGLNIPEKQFDMETEPITVTSINRLDEKTLTVGTKKGILVVSREKQEHLLPDADISSVLKDSRQNLWISTANQGVYRVSPDKEIKQYKHITGQNSISNDQARVITEDDAGDIWVGTFYGLNRYNPSNDRWDAYTHTENVPQSISHSSVFALYKDMQGTIWVGTYFGGVNYFNPDADIFHYYGADTDDPSLLSFPFVGKMTEDSQGNLWIGTEGGGLNCLHLKTGQFSHYLYNGKKTQPVNIKCLWYDSASERLYLGIHHGGLCIFNCKNKTARYLTHQPEQPHSLPNNTINDMQYFEGSLYLLTQKGLTRFDLKEETFHPVSSNREITETLDNCFTYTFHIDRNKQLWIGGSGQLYCIDLTETKPVKSYFWDKNKPHSIGKFEIVCIHKATNGALYFGTLGSGVFKYRPDTDDFENYTEESGEILSNYCYHISETASHHLVLVQNKGVTLLDPSSGSQKIFCSTKGFPIVGFTLGCGSYVTKANEIFVGGVNGLVSFQASDLLKIQKPYTLFFDKIQLNNKQILPGDKSGILPQALAFCKEIELKHDQSNFTIEFSTSNYLQHRPDYFEYKLEGFDNDWIKCQSNLITYTNLSPGNYTLLVKRTDLDRKENPEIKKLGIRVMSPFYASTPAYILYALLFIGLFIALSRFYLWREKMKTSLAFERKEKEQNEELTQSKLHFFTNISHEFQTPLTLILIQTESLLQSTQLGNRVYNKIVRIYNNANHLRNLIRELLDFTKQQQGKVRLMLKQVDIVSYTREIFNSFSEYAAKQKIHYSFRAMEDTIPAWIDPVQFSKVIYNVLSNAFKFTPAEGSISVRIKQEEQKIQIEIKDSGIGIPAESLDKLFDRFYQVEHRSSSYSLGTGIGLAFAKEIVTLHKGEIKAESIVGKGSIFTIILLSGEGHFSEEEKRSGDIKESDPSAFSKLDFSEIKVADETEELSESVPEGEKPIILIIEDNMDMLETLVELFKPAYMVYTASNGKEGLEMTLEIQPNLVLSDVMMPEMSGKEMCYKIKNNIHISHIPVVLLTAQTSVSQTIEGYMYGADEYITKPFNLRILLARCNNLVKSRKLLFQRITSQPQNLILPTATANVKEEQLIKQAEIVIRENFSNTDFDINKLAGKLGIGRSKLYEKLKEITGLTPNEFVLNMKFKEASKLLVERKDMNISEIAYHLGFSSAKYFSKSFKAFYGVTPIEWREKHA